MKNIIELKNIKKQYKGFEFDIPEFGLPEGFAVSVIGENGAGKSTFLDILAGLNYEYKGEITYFGKNSSADDAGVREKIGYTSPGSFFVPTWRASQIPQICSMLFDGFDEQKYNKYCDEFAVFPDGVKQSEKKISAFSDGNIMRLMIAVVLARDTDILIMDEPASPLDPLMRDKLCDCIRDYLDRGDGKKSVIFSTHNISDMESVTDYAVIMAGGKIAEQGFTEDLKEKYILVKGELSDLEKVKDHMYTYSENRFGFEGLCLAEDLDRLAGTDISMETPTLHQISTAVMKKHTSLKG